LDNLSLDVLINFVLIKKKEFELDIVCDVIELPEDGAKNAKN